MKQIKRLLKFLNLTQEDGTLSLSNLLVLWFANLITFTTILSIWLPNLTNTISSLSMVIGLIGCVANVSHQRYTDHKETMAKLMNDKAQQIQIDELSKNLTTTTNKLELLTNSLAMNANMINPKGLHR